MLIRQEKAEDYEAVYHVVQEAFRNAEYTDGNEQNLVVALRKSKAFIPELSLVAVEDQRVVGYILFTKAVLPEYQNRGMGLDLIAEGHRAARSLGYGYSVVLGHPQYYPKAGYLPASRYGIRAPFPVADENFMVICLNAEPKPLDGIMEYDPAFGI